MSADHNDTLHPMRHSLAHIAASAVKRLWPEAKFGVGPVVENGFYYDIDLGDTTISEADFGKIESVMKKIVRENQVFERSTMPLEEAITWAETAKQPYKKELLHDLQRAGTTVAKELDADELGLEATGDSKVDEVSFYTNGDFTDLCRGPHVESTGKVGAFKLMRVAGAYWRGKEGNPQMQRLYGVAFATREELDAYLKALQEAKSRDHRLLGKQLDLFAFSDLVGSGLPLFTPRGTTIRNLLKQALLQTGAKYGGQEVGIPHIAKRELYEISGHAQKFSDELFAVKSHYDVDFVMKPVNCPHHTQIYASQPRSYRDLPISYMESTMQYRDEKPGQIGGLGRVRAITVDDGHLFCTVDQIKQEVVKFCNFIEEFHTALGMYGDHWVSLSVRDYSKPDQYIGDAADWDKAEAMLEELAGELKLGAKKMEGEAALYGPKLDFMYKDVLGNERQLSTVQLDFSTPKRFKLTYTDADGSEKAPVMIHRAILGSYERFMAILLEKTAGWLPFWLAPEQIRILTINDTVLDYVSEVKEVLDGVVLMTPLKYNELRYKLDDRSESLGRKIRDAVEMKVPVVLIVGNKDVEVRQVSVRLRDKEEKVDIDKLQQYLQQIQ
ncbi:MAG TPA: threonine--tRNA ligase [Candidatus Saccharimonadales bacterium]|nr:threonine--tRNA ligase [Candidatus Saccharimonadales bacterium]